jgi:hypothetical protein
VSSSSLVKDIEPKLLKDIKFARSLSGACSAISFRCLNISCYGAVFVLLNIKFKSVSMTSRRLNGAEVFDKFKSTS